MITNYYQSFNLSKHRDYLKFKKEFNDLVSDYGKPQSSYQSDSLNPDICVYQWFVYDKSLDIHEIYTIIVYKSKI